MTNPSDNAKDIRQQLALDTADSPTFAGVTLPSTPGSSAANVLDCYEENLNWTPQLIGSNGGSQTLSVAQGKYVRIGSLVHVNIQIEYTNLGTLSGYLQIPLPYSSPMPQAGSMYSANIANLSNYIQVTPIAVGSVIWFYKTREINGEVVNTSELSPYGVLLVSVSYFV